MNPMKSVLVARARAVSSLCYVHLEIHMPSAATATPSSLMWMKPFMDGLNYFDPLIKTVSKSVMGAIALWKFQSSALAFKECSDEYFRQRNKHIEIDRERNKLLKEIAETHKDLGFFLKQWRKSWDESEAAARDDGGKDGVSK